jgi:glycosyltransferase involved in cell wall biosynthesis
MTSYLTVPDPTVTPPPAHARAGRTLGSVRPFTLAVALIVKNEERCLARCLASVGELTEIGVVDELVVVDTGSTDRTVEIAREYGAAVHSTPWTDDFAAARNIAIGHCHSDWVLMLDADEWLTPGAADALRHLHWTPPEFIGEIEVVSAIELRTESGIAPEPGAAEITSTSGWIPRLLPAGAHWEGRVHEQPVWDGEHRRTAISVGHDGYAPGVIEHKRGRNAALLRAEIERHPDDAYLLLQLGRALESDREFPEAAETYQRALALTPSTEPARHDLVVRMLFTLGQAGRTADAVSLAEAEMAHWGDSPDFNFCLGDLLLSHGLAHPEATAEVLPVIEGSWLRCLELGERPELVGAVAGRGSYLAAYNLAVLYEAMGNSAKAAEYQQLFRDLRSLR